MGGQWAWCLWQEIQSWVSHGLASHLSYTTGNLETLTHQNAFGLTERIWGEDANSAIQMPRSGAVKPQ